LADSVSGAQPSWLGGVVGALPVLPVSRPSPIQNTC